MSARPAHPIRTLLVGVRSHGGEEVYSTLLRDAPPEGVDIDSTFDFHESCRRARSHGIAEVLLNQLVHPFLRFDLGFRVLSVGDDVDLIHVHSHPCVLLRRRDRPVVFSAGSSHYHYVRDYEHWSEAKIAVRHRRARRFYRHLGITDALLNPDAVTLAYTFSDEARAVYLRFGVPAHKIRRLYPGFPVPVLAARAPAENVTFLFMGRDPQRKGGDHVLQAFAALQQDAPSARLLFVSDERPAELPKGATYHALVPRSEIGRFFEAADVFVNPTRAEGFGFTNAEAQGYGLPVISTRLGAIPEVVDDGRTGLLVAPGEANELLSAMKRLAREPRLRQDMGAAARERFERLFALPVFQRGLRALYDEALMLGAHA